MLKQLKRNDIAVTPYIAIKNWNLSNVANNDLVLAENGNIVSSEAVNYFFTYTQPVYCNVAKEDQEDDLANYREGLKKSGLFFSEKESQNLDGTFKRIVHSQIKTMFYNNYRDPTKIWGMEKINFDTSEVKKFLSDYIKVFDIPSEIMGENIIKNSISFTDNTLDNAYNISDDGKCNLFAGSNLFSKQQILGEFDNIFSSGSNNECNYYLSFTTSSIPILVGSTNIFSLDLERTSSLSWTIDIIPIGFYVEKSLDGVTFSTLGSYDPTIFFAYDYPILANTNYFYRMYSYNMWGSSSYSNVVTISFSM